MNILLLKGFNNYFNRIVIKYDSLTDYQDGSKSYINYSGINFNSNDGVSTELVIGSETQQIIIDENTKKPLDWENDGSPDYLVCYEMEGTPSAAVIKSRWFVIECQRTRLGQYKLTLKRDSLADHYDEVTEATCFIEKGIVQNTEDSAIYNKEDITTNQIKSDEFLLKDETQCGWVVGYVAKDRESSGTLTPTTFTEQTISGPDASDSACDEIFADETAFYNAHPELIGDLASLNSWAASVSLDIWYSRWLSYYKVGQTITCYHTGNVSYAESAYNHDNYLHTTTVKPNRFYWKDWFGDYRDPTAKNFVSGWRTSAFNTNLLQQIGYKENVNFTSESDLQKFFNYVKRDPTIKIGSKYYKPYDKYGGEGATSTISNEQFITLGSTAYDLLYNGLDLTPDGVSGHDTIGGTPGPETFKLSYSYNRHALGLREIFSKCKAKVPASVPVLKDAPYHMFAIPYSDDLALYSGNTLHCVTNKSVAMNAAQALATHAGAGVVYDIQLLPYCPIRDIIKTDKVAAQAELCPATYDKVTVKTGQGQIITWLKLPIVKLNHQYVINKSITLSNNSRLIGLSSASPIYIKFGTSNLENPSEVIRVKKIEVRYSDINDTTSDVIIALYNNQNDETPSRTIDYAAYASGSQLIGAYFTNICWYAEVTQNILNPGTYSINYWPRQSGSRVYSTTNPYMFDDYYYYEDYYLSKIDISNAITSDIVTMIGDTETDIVSTIFWCTESQFSFNKFMDNYFLLQGDGTYKQDEITSLINDHVKLGYSPELGINVKDIKVRNQVEMMRLASPNYSNFFDINVQRNRGVEYINIDCTYKPYAPYMHLNPNFKGLYGADYNDVRGLICGGDYSIALTTDAWATYQLQNKNYQAVFDRQIQQLETAQSIQAQSDIINAIAGTGTGVIGGALVGAKAGGVYGAIAGAVVGGAASGIGGAADVYNNQRMRELQVSAMKDIHGYQLDNIKALPQGLSKTSYLTNNNKLFPFLEFYTCTPIEEQAVRDLLDYNGMTINRVGKIKDFQSENDLPYIKAKLIRIEMVDDAHQTKAISEELSTGVYLPKQEETEGE